MRVLWSWLLELCDLDRQVTPDEGAIALTRGGLEIEGVENLGTGFSGVVVAEVVGKRPHPDAAKLTLVDVITERGGAATQVVCGASNVPEPGRKVLWAQIGAKLPGDITLAAKPVKGIVSPGMLCAEDELGLGDDHAGIIVLDAGDPTPLGAPAQQALGLADHVLELSTPANRATCSGSSASRASSSRCSAAASCRPMRSSTVSSMPAARRSRSTCKTRHCARVTPRA
jgi:phenylalanyl-tRNA synthetase beta chain